jgi:hypothetical protein
MLMTPKPDRTEVLFITHELWLLFIATSSFNSHKRPPEPVRGQ